MSEQVSQRLKILRYLAQGYSLTPIEALEKFGCFALSQRIGELKREGWPISSRRIRTKTGKHVACYDLRATERVSA